MSRSKRIRRKPHFINAEQLMLVDSFVRRGVRERKFAVNKGCRIRLLAIVYNDMELGCFDDYDGFVRFVKERMEGER